MSLPLYDGGRAKSSTRSAQASAAFWIRFIVTCSSWPALPITSTGAAGEAEQERVYQDLTERGLSCRVVVT